MRYGSKPNSSGFDAAAWLIMPKTLLARLYARAMIPASVVVQFEFKIGWRGISRFDVAPEAWRRNTLRPATQEIGFNFYDDSSISAPVSPA